MELDNRWVVPYNAWLSLKYNCHINVELTVSVAAVKYLYKYVYKGHDKTQASFQRAENAAAVPDGLAAPQDIDEIQIYMDARL